MVTGGINHAHPCLATSKMHARGACNAVNEVRDFYQLQSFQSVRASFGSQMDVKGYKKVRVVVKYHSFHNLFCVRLGSALFF